MITQTNAFVVVLDTCVLVPMPLCDTLLRLAEDPAFYMPRWSAGILDELRRVLCRMQYTEAQAERRITAMQCAFEDACVAQPVDVHQHARSVFFHSGHGVGFQAQLLSDKGLYEHFGSVPFVFLGRKLRK